MGEQSKRPAQTGGTAARRNEAEAVQKADGSARESLIKSSAVKLDVCKALILNAFLCGLKNSVSLGAMVQAPGSPSRAQVPAG